MLAFKAAPRRHVTGILQLFRERAAEWPQDARELSIQARTAKGRDLFCRIEHATKGVPDRVCYAEHPSAALSPQRVTRQCVASPLLAISPPHLVRKTAEETSTAQLRKSQQLLGSTFHVRVRVVPCRSR